MSLWLYEQRLADPRRFNRIELALYRFGLFYDRLYNLLVLTLIFLEWPQHYRETASQRFLRHRHSQTFRGVMARWCWCTFIHPAAPHHHQTMRRKFRHED